MNPRGHFSENELSYPYSNFPPQTYEPSELCFLIMIIILIIWWHLPVLHNRKMGSSCPNNLCIINTYCPPFWQASINDNTGSSVLTSKQCMSWKSTLLLALFYLKTPSNNLLKVECLKIEITYFPLMFFHISSKCTTK